MPGKVFLIGMGPGDPELITIKAIKAVQKCDILIYDRLVNNKLLDYNKTAERIYVGKASGSHTLKQEEINRLLVEKAGAGLNIGRLKGGDPFVFGRGGEEALFLRENGISYEIIPGITSSIAVPMYAGIPVTFRGMATSFHVITGHEQDEHNNIDWDALARIKGTLIFLMGVENLGFIVRHLVSRGKSMYCPAAVIMNGTRENQREVYGTLENIEELCRQNEIASPAIIVVGEVVSLHEAVRWKESLPLFGLRVVSTRPAEKADYLIDGLKSKGAIVYNIPCIEISGLRGIHFDKDEAASYDGIIFSSTYGVRYFMECLKENGVDIRNIRARFYGVGKSVKEALAEYGLPDCIIPEIYNAEELVEVIRRNASAGDRLLVVAGNLGSETLLEGLKDFEINRLEVYRTLEKCEEAAEEDIDCIIFTSPSCVRGFLSLNEIEKFKAKKVICIGKSTMEQAQAAGFTAASALENALPELIIDKLINWRKGSND